MSRVTALLIVTAVWAAIYLPALGSLEIKGEEGRRILPAVAMLESGNYVVPRVGSAAYFSKPPLINWVVAASFEIFGQRNEWTARLPSAFCVLAVAVAFVTVARASLRPTGSVLAALIWLTNFGIIEKGRLIEIEALYVSLCGLAIIFWLSFWEQNKSPWLVWIPASIFLGLGLLAKGPMLLLFFYAIVLSVVWQAKDARVFFHPAHLVGIAVMLSIFAAWAVPFAQSATVKLAMFKWSRQFSGRLSGEDFKFSSWILNVPRSLGYFLPWLLLLPCLPSAKFSSEGKLEIASDCRSCPGIAAALHDAIARAGLRALRSGLDCGRSYLAKTFWRQKNFGARSTTYCRRGGDRDLRVHFCLRSRARPEIASEAKGQVDCHANRCGRAARGTPLCARSGLSAFSFLYALEIGLRK